MISSGNHLCPTSFRLPWWSRASAKGFLDSNFAAKKNIKHQLISPIVARWFAHSQLPVVTTLVGPGCRTQLGIDHPRDHLCRRLCSAEPCYHNGMVATCTLRFHHETMWTSEQLPSLVKNLAAAVAWCWSDGCEQSCEFWHGKGRIWLNRLVVKMPKINPFVILRSTTPWGPCDSLRAHIVSYSQWAVFSNHQVTTKWLS